ncbi:bifunctional serine/threonine-protein kinase/formylglycine-generating enzyme family protein [Myxococcota bacterium]|nr:bifunctional serine/threonine-protein kinase/formylglycine-generating enzyme family protein [Myxococcota bacterium]
MKETAPHDDGPVGTDTSPGLDAPSPEGLPVAPQAGFPRYRFAERLGVGGMGEVWLAEDSRLGRSVALKLVREERRDDARVTRAILHEAEILAAVAHPNVVPVHDLGQTEDGRWFYAMKRVEGRTLAEVLAALVRRDPGVEESFPQAHLVQVFRQIALTIAHVHSRGVIHRDIKPPNVMLGPYGEVQLIDWGLARRRIARDEPLPDEPDAPPAAAIEVHSLDQGMVQGTPAYMAPEQVLGRFEEVDERSDVYGLGAILYEILCLRSPFVIEAGESVIPFLRRVVRTEPPLCSAVAPPGRDVPPDLEDLAMRCLSRRRAARPESALAVVEAVDAWIQGVGETKARRGAAEARARTGAAELARWRALRARGIADGAHVARRAGQALPWGGVEEKRPLWALLSWVESTGREAESAFSASARAFHEALALDSGNETARAGLADLHVGRWRDLLDAGPAAAAERTRCEEIARLYDDGRHARELRPELRLSFGHLPAGVEVAVARVREADLRRGPEEFRVLGRTPLRPQKLERGEWVLRLSLPGHAPARFPIAVVRGEDAGLDVRLPGADRIPEGMVYVPGGEAAVGGDPAAPGALPAGTAFVPDFAIGRLPVSFAEYLEFVAAVFERNPQEARRRLPRPPLLARSRWEKAADGGIVLDMSPGEKAVQKGVPPGPVFGVSWDDARAYCAWRGDRDGFAYRLPGDLEWEKAARGPFRWSFPWGDAFDPSFCRMGLSRGTTPRSGPSAAFPADVSVYGVQDLAGGVREWCSDFFDENADLRLARGGGWQCREPDCRACARAGLRPDTRADDLGLRLALSLD